MRTHFFLRFTLGLLASTSAAILIPRGANGTLQDRTTIYFPGPIPGHSNTRTIHDDLQVAAKLASRSSSDNTNSITTGELPASEEGTDENSMNGGKNSSKRALVPSTAPKGDEKVKKKKSTDDLWPKVGAVAGAVVVLVCIVVGYKVHKKGHQKEMGRMKRGKQEKKKWYGNSEYRARRTTVHG
ncbi:hypothetical protein B0T09DRAFT_169028 [Sordaria sp. MPI-SDFR-AT-0083]|nr:hypothetical protein B0T09DRAFT_169028 [Sordaria sp. MPI-SDFR-AT-0083]